MNWSWWHSIQILYRMLFLLLLLFLQSSDYFENFKFFFAKQQLFWVFKVIFLAKQFYLEILKYLNTRFRMEWNIIFSLLKLGRLYDREVAEHKIGPQLRWVCCHPNIDSQTTIWWSRYRKHLQCLINKLLFGFRVDVSIFTFYYTEGVIEKLCF